MSDYILMDGDQVIFLPIFGNAIVAVQPGQLKATGKAILQGNKVCIEGDEQQVSVPGCTYLTPVYSIPGIGTLQIQSLAADQKTQCLITSNKPVLLKGSQFTAKFSITVPAQLPPPASTPDPTPDYKGQGQFLSTNMRWQSR